MTKAEANAAVWVGLSIISWPSTSYQTLQSYLHPIFLGSLPMDGGSSPSGKKVFPQDGEPIDVDAGPLLEMLIWGLTRKPRR